MGQNHAETEPQELEEIASECPSTEDLREASAALEHLCDRHTKGSAAGLERVAVWLELLATSLDIGGMSDAERSG